MASESEFAGPPGLTAMCALCQEGMSFQQNLTFLIHNPDRLSRQTQDLDNYSTLPPPITSEDLEIAQLSPDDLQLLAGSR